MNATTLTALIIAVTGLLGAVPAIIIALRSNATSKRLEANVPRAIANAIGGHEGREHP